MNDIVPKPSSLPGALAWEIARVAAKRQRWLSMAEDWKNAGGETVAMTPGIMLMTESLANAIAAAAVGDIEGEMRAIEDLKGWSDDD